MDNRITLICYARLFPLNTKMPCIVNYIGSSYTVMQLMGHKLLHKEMKTMDIFNNIII